ncbi:MAG: serine/threonine-protein kinase [Myxococcota bacterium]
MEPSERYRDLEPLASGGMGEVFRARMTTDAGVDKRVALKLVREDLAADPQFAAMFLEEAKVAMAMSHGNVVQAFDAGWLGDRPFLAMEFVDGSDLAEYLGAPLDVEIALSIALEACRGLSYAHRLRGEDGRELGVVHRDISPSNLLVSKDGEVKIADFGIARGARDRQGERGLRGKLAYMAPEQLKGLPVDGRADVYALAAVLYEMLTGRAPFADERRDAMPTPVSSVADVPGRVDEVVARGLSTDPAQRFADAEAFAEALRAAASDHAIRVGASAIRRLVARAPASPGFDFDAALGAAMGESPSPTARTGTVLVTPTKRPARSRGGIAALLLLGVAVGGFWVARSQRSGTPVEVARARNEPAAEVSAREPVAMEPSVVEPVEVREGVPSEEAARMTPPRMRPIPRTEMAVTRTPAIETPPIETPVIETPPETGRAELWIASDPWAFVEIDGRRVGRTTLRAHSLPAGSHRVVLQNPEAQLRHELTLNLRDGERRRISVDDWQ